MQKKSGKKSVKKNISRPALQKTGRVRTGKALTRDVVVPEDPYGHLPDEDESDRYMTLGEHLDELRQKIIYSSLAIFLISLGSGIFSDEIHKFLTSPFLKMKIPNPLVPGGFLTPSLILGNIYGPMEVMILVAVSAGFILSLPIILVLFWGFITPALSRKTARVGYVSVAASTILFWAGIYFCWVYVYPISLEFMLLGMLPLGTQPVLTLETYYDFLIMLHVGSGLLFQLPVLFVLLGALGILSLEWHKRVWKYVILGIVIFAALATPPDFLSQIIFSIPLVVLYVISLLIIWLIERGRKKKDLELEDSE